MSKHTRSKSGPDLCGLRKMRLRCIQQTSVCCTLPFVPLTPPLYRQLPFYIAIATTTSTGKLMFHIIGAMAEFERDVISERTQAGLDAARARGRRGGRPKATQKIEPRNLARAKELYAAKNNTIAEIMQMTGFRSRNTFYKYVVNAERS